MLARDLSRRSGRTSLTYRDFFGIVSHELPALLPPDLRDYQSARQGRVHKVFFEDRRHHYELWFRDGGLEIAYHLEGPAEQNEPVVELLRRRLAALRRSLGGDVRLEPFGAGWTHLFELWPGVSRDQDEAPEVAARLAEFVRQLEPMLRADQRPSR